jgi:UDP-N-acetylmuramoyl-tripeptide--D-alanyl-D-alanine ligase
LGKFVGIDKAGHNQLSVHYNKKKIILKLKILGQHNFINALAAAAVGLEFKVKPDDIQDALIDFNPTERRMELKEINGITILNDCYNSNPDSLKAALETMKNLPTKNKKIIVLGDMLEIGKDKKIEHENAAMLINKLGFKYAFLYGPLSYYTYKTIANKIDYCKHYDDKDNLFKDLIKMVQPGDLVLVKGSRGMKMETVIERLYSR